MSGQKRPDYAGVNEEDESRLFNERVASPDVGIAPNNFHYTMAL